MLLSSRVLRYPPPYWTCTVLKCQNNYAEGILAMNTTSKHIYNDYKKIKDTKNEENSMKTPMKEPIHLIRYTVGI